MLIGITGNIGSGKTEAARMFADAGYRLFTADTMAHELYASNSDLVHMIKESFGAHVVTHEGLLDRAELGRIVFSSQESLQKLNALVHPILIQYLKDAISACAEPRVVLDAALIVEWDMCSFFDALIVVTCDDLIRCERLMQRNTLSHDEAMRRIEAQMPQHEKIPFADYHIDNSGSLELLKKSVAEVMNDLTSDLSL